jgi:hypothetical protein
MPSQIKEAETMSTLKDYPEWDSYIETFVTYFVRKHFHVRRGYADGFKREKNDKFANVSINEENIEQVVSKHLDLVAWNEHHPDDQEEFFWLAQYGPVKTRLDCIDYDNKENIVGKELITDDRGRRQPVVGYPLSQLQVLKRLYDLFPGRIWCISSETLGFHIWNRVGPNELLHVRQERVQRRLATIGMEKTEVHPMSGWPQRRPFGEHYRTITGNGVLTDWRAQTRHFLNPGSVPSFQQIYDEIRSSLLRQWNQFDGNPDMLERFCEQLDETDVSMCAGCPLEQQQLSEPVTGSSQKKTSSVKNGPQPVSQNDEPDFCKKSVNNEKPSLANLLKWSICGLLEDDTVFPVCREITYWLFFVELSCKDKESRCQQISELLHDFIALKHNCFSDRINQGDHDVYSQLDRIIYFVSKDKLNRKQHFVSLKENIDNGKYEYPFSIAPLLTKVFSTEFKDKAIASLDSSPPSFSFLKQLLTSTSSNNSSPAPLRSDYSCISTYEENCCCPQLEEMLEEYFINGPSQPWKDVDAPSEVMRQMIEERKLLEKPERELNEKPLNHKMRKDKQKKVTEFAKCVVAKLAANGGEDSVGHEFCFKVFGYKNPTRATEFLQHLVAADIIINVHPGIRGEKSAGYQLSLPIMDAIEVNGEPLREAVP